MKRELQGSGFIEYRKFETQHAEPLYLAAASGRIMQRAFQESDAKTASHMLSAVSPSREAAKESLEKIHKNEYLPIFYSDIQKYLPKEEWFLKEGHAHSIHGVRHISRVITYSLLLAQLENLNDNERKVVATAAGIHDIGRIDDRNDLEHGKRSADIFTNSLHGEFAKRGLTYSQEDIADIYQLSFYHEYKYEDIPEYIKKRRLGVLLDVLMAADALDRFRLPKENWWPNKELLRLESAKELLPLASYVTLNSEKDYFVEGQNFFDSLFRRGQEVGLFTFHERSLDALKEADSIERWWQTFLRQTPNGHLLTFNNLFETIKKGQGLILVHVTPSLEKIKETGVISASGGALGASIYATPLRQDGKVHNLTNFIRNVQLQDRHTDIIAFMFPQENFSSNKTQFKGMDYLTFGTLQTELFCKQVIDGIFSRQEIDYIKNEASSRIAGAHEFLARCSSYDLQSVTNEEFNELFESARKHVPFFNNVLFESMAEYISLYQDDEKSKLLASEGELNTSNYLKLALDLSPSLYKKFNLLEFGPTIEEIANYLDENSERIIAAFSRDHFLSYMKWRMAAIIRNKVLDGKSLPMQQATFEQYLLTNPSLVGHVIAQLIRSSDTVSQEHYIDYEKARAETFWNHWTEENILVPFFASLPKGEVGINPRNPNLTYSVHEANIDDNGYLHIGEKLSVRMVDKVIDPQVAVLRRGL